MFTTEGLRALGSVFYAGNGSKARMKQHALATGATCQLGVTEPDSGNRGFMCYADWPTCLQNISRLSEQRRHVNELVPPHVQCKPYLDIDARVAPPSLQTEDAIISRTNTLVATIFQEDYGVDLSPNALVWLRSPSHDKISLHLIVSTHSPQWVFRSNLKVDDRGAGHLPSRIAEMDPELGSIVDHEVYTRDREFRMCGSCKHGKDSVLEMVTDVPFRDTLITWLDDHVTEIRVPTLVPAVVRKRLVVTHPSQMVERVKEDCATPEVRSRVLGMLRDGIHPTARRDPRGTQNIYDASCGMKFNYDDRSEECYTGVLHRGVQNFKVWIDDCDDVWMRCYGHPCNQRAHYLGNLNDDDSQCYDNCVRINTRFLQREPIGQVTIHDAVNLTNAGGRVLSFVVNRWLRGCFKVLNIRSPMGSGKTTMLRSLVDDDFSHGTVLIVTYRQTLAYNLASKLQEFHNYLDDGPIHDRDACPRVICQVDSIQRLAPYEQQVPRFDLVILDEMESLLQHLAASTLKRPRWVASKLISIMEMAGRVITMDALWGAASHDFLEESKLSHQLILNEFRTAPRTFVFTRAQESWVRDMVEDLRAGRNIVVVSMSTEQLRRVVNALVKSGAVADDETLVHTSKTDDDVKKQLIDVNTLWNEPRLVGYTPTIEAGVDYTGTRFHRMYVYACLFSTTPLGLFQMTGRVRHLGDAHIRCCAAQGISLETSSKHVRVAVRNQLAFYQWIDQKTADLGDFGTVMMGTEGMLARKTSPYLLAISHAAAREHNGQSRFFLEFKRLAESEGHHVTVDARMENDTNVVELAPTGERMEMLLNLPDLTDVEFDAVNSRVVGNCASSKDKWLHYRHCYKAAWGVSTVTVAFVEEFGTGMGCPRVHLCMRILYPDMKVKAYAAPTHSALVLKAALVSQVLQACGWRHPFDCGKTVAYEDVREAVMQTDCFKDYTRHSLLFSGKAGRAKDWNVVKNLTDSLKMILGAARIELKSTSTGRSNRKYTYSIGERDAHVTAALINLKRGQRTSACHEAQQFLDSVGFGHLASLATCEGPRTVPDLEFTDI